MASLSFRARNGWSIRARLEGRLNAIIHICDENGDEVPVGQEGTVFFESDSKFSYHNDLEKTRASRHPAHENWSMLGDVGRVDEEGYLYLTDRKSFMIISGGVNIYPQEIENHLVTHPKVQDVAVIGGPHDEMGEEVIAVVQPLDMADAAKRCAMNLPLMHAKSCRESRSRDGSTSARNCRDMIPANYTSACFATNIGRRMARHNARHPCASRYLRWQCTNA